MWLVIVRLYQWFAPPDQPKRLRSQARYFRPQLEGLEDRTVPDAYQFANPVAGASWTVVGNWIDLTQGGAAATQLPGSSDTADIPSGAFAVLNDTNPQTVAGLSVEGQLNLGSKLSVTTGSSTGTFNEGTGGDLDVISSMDFYGNGVTMGRIDTGSSIDFRLGSAMTLAAGTSFVGGGLVSINGPVTVTAALSPDATVALNNDGGITTNGSLTGSGSLSIGHDMLWTGGLLGLTGGTTIESAGSLAVSGSDNKILGALLTNESMFCNFDGSGLFVMTAPGGTTGGTIDNAAGQMSVTLPTFVNTGATGAAITNEALGTFKEAADTTLSGVTLNNIGKLNIESGSSLTLSFAAPMSSHALDGTLQLDGDLTLLSAVTDPTGLDVAPGSGTLKIGNGSTAGSLTQPSGGDLELFGNLEVTSTGTLAGGEVDNNGDLNLDVGSATALGSYVQSTTGTLDVHAAMPPMSPPVNSKLTVSGSASLSGVLKLDLDGGYVPTSGTAFTVLTAGTIANHFDTTPDGWTPSYAAGALTITKN